VSSDTIESLGEPPSAEGNWPVRVLVAKIGMDGHDRGARIVARALRDAGMEVVYTGRHVSVAYIVDTAIEEDVDVIVGGTVATGAERQALLDLGVADVFPGATPLPAVAARVHAVAVERRRRLGLTREA
jgi:methylmalonyl-CoA mutase cobalamin-binding subunit